MMNLLKFLFPWLCEVKYTNKFTPSDKCQQIFNEWIQYK